MPKAIIVVEGDYEETIERDTDELLAAFSEGFSEGVSHYGSGSAGVYTRKDLEDLFPEDEFDAPLIRLIEKHLPEGS